MNPIPDMPADWVKIAFDKGLSMAIAALVVFLIWKYGQRLLDGHLSFMETAKKTQSDLATAYKTLSERDDGTTHRALEHIANAAKHATNEPKVHWHLDNAIGELKHGRHSE
jgi:uncharacterized membrane protein YccC